MIHRLMALLLAGGVVFASLAAFADEPPADKDEPPLRLKKKNRPADPPAKDEKAKPPLDEDKKPDKPDADKGREPPPAPEEDEQEILQRITKNVRSVEERLANKELGEGTRQLQEDVLKDIDSLIAAAQRPPQGGENSENSSADQSQQPQNGQKQRNQMKSSRQQRGSRQQRNARGQRQGSQQGQGQQEQMANQGGANNPGGGGNKGGGTDDKNADLYKEVWGHLPESMRGEMNAYFKNQHFMAKYEDAIKRYYRTLAEQGRKKEN
jgi:hypothetical protein